jgi:hypothetical protein
MTITATTPIRSTSLIETRSDSWGKKSEAIAASRRKTPGSGTGKRSFSLVASSASSNPPETTSTIVPNSTSSSTPKPFPYKSMNQVKPHVAILTSCAEQRSSLPAR